MTVYRLDLAYDGSGYRGYARQAGLRTVQGSLEDALETILGEPVETAVAGRTDAGVHARGQVASFEADELDTEALARSLNGILGPEIAINGLATAEEGFHARFSARWRRYRYAIRNADAPDPMRRHEEWHVARWLDVAEMTGAAAPLTGEHDFSSFCRTVEGSSNVRRVESAYWVADGERLEFWILANAFCQQMVRSIVGFCYDVGRGFTTADRAIEVLDARDRSAVATVAPPHGLTLWEVGY